MGRVGEYREALRAQPDWVAYLRAESGLPGPRGNLELAAAVAEEGDEPLFRALLAFDSERAPANTPDEYLFFCGVLGLGVLLAGGDASVLAELRVHAGDPRWRTREAVAMALQRYGRANWQALYAELLRWAEGTLLERRAAVAALCEPDLLSTEARACLVLDLLAKVTASLADETERRGDAFRALRQGLGYCWSVALAAAPEQGKAAFCAWCDSGDRDVRWVLRENLKKSRLVRMDATWVAECNRQLAG